MVPRDDNTCIVFFSFSDNGGIPTFKFYGTKNNIAKQVTLQDAQNAISALPNSDLDSDDEALSDVEDKNENEDSDSDDDEYDMPLSELRKILLKQKGETVGLREIFHNQIQYFPQMFMLKKLIILIQF